MSMLAKCEVRRERKVFLCLLDDLGVLFTFTFPPKYGSLEWEGTRNGAHAKYHMVLCTTAQAVNFSDQTYLSELSHSARRTAHVVWSRGQKGHEMSTSFDSPCWPDEYHWNRLHFLTINSIPHFYNVKVNGGEAGGLDYSVADKFSHNYSASILVQLL